ncbi:AAA domain-containing protein [Bacillus hwajinpoensis]|uniref:AAA domain-containing protein n=1 Tax=Guptibacillus hwajinpoensis TaxID=208199 RepID=A0A845EZT1_9BACL|nr:MoxR family ATPase [Pseudalkalibacillus hwajinpoensis]MYL64039.1 AAA domain-containing protein [Pseudalkalibacillus hwajinpoensis]
MQLYETFDIPDKIQNRIEDRRDSNTNPDHYLIGSEGYTAPDMSIVKDAVTALILGKNVLLKGPTGAGKTKLAELISYFFNQPMYSINCSVDLDAEALLGYKTLSYDEQNNAHITFIPGPVENAMKNGELLYIDEINTAKAETLPILNGVLDYRRMVLNPFTGETVRAKENFGVIAAINEGYIGTAPLNEALKNRFIVIEVPYLQGEALKEMLSEQSLLDDSDQLDQFVTLSADLQSKVRDGQISEEAASPRSLLDACDLTTFMEARRAIKRAITDKLEDEREKAAVENIAETIFGRYQEKA